MYIVYEPAGVWIAGDYLSEVEFPLVEDGIDTYRRTMAKTDRILRAHSIKWLIPGHGTVADSKEEILRRRDHAIEYLDDLESLIESNIPFPIEKYRNRYPFWSGLEQWHQSQIKKWKN
jgi:hypothetical protein